ADHVFTNDVVRALAKAAPGTVLAGSDGQAIAAIGEANEALEDPNGPAGPTAIALSALVAPEDAALRKRAIPVAAPARTAQEAAAAERALFAASYKGATDVLTKHVWPAPALVATRWCARAGLSPNQVTAASAVLMLAAFWLFWEGWLLAGLLVGYAMVFLDTVDGKLARVTLTYSKLGDVFDHGIDLVHPPFWWWAWAVGCGAVGQPLDDGGWTLGLIVGGYVLQRAEEGWFIARFGIEMHVWRRFDSLFRQITARRNPNLLILTASVLLGAPREGLIAVAAWVVLCLLVHLVRIVQAHASVGPVQSWLAEPLA
ncbi:MAG: CDP-alcohol phosphatidyltransferase family protein, partial [Pseudomonadota bacterium]